MITGLTVLTDPHCPLCRRFAAWLGGQPTLVPLELLAAGSDEARRRWPTLDHASTLEDITVVGSDGSVWTKEHAWVMCLWATRPYRGLAERLSRPQLLPLARGAALGAAGLRHLLTREEVQRDDYPDACAGSCQPIAQG
ncbi:DUF393 domain-containing protein [Nocardioides sp. SR21]|uniref:DUF393 domain-containing protein n=1 Tax=Nocardioides sp. SR21 TaxID=2919501 RepID=UPI001FA96A2A|nr:DUF393 domain-containing protein [Nocardioides sp. SR21]